MHRDYERAHEWTPKVIGAAIEVLREKGSGLIESIYEMHNERIGAPQIPAINQVVVPIEYKGYVFDQPLKLDLYIDSCLIVELKAVQEILPVHKAQLLSYMKLLDAPLGLLINFHERLLKNGVHRLILEGADRS